MVGLATPRPDEELDLKGAVPFLLVHVVALVTPFYTGITWEALAWCFGMYYLRMFAVTAGYHRYFSHRTYKTSRAFQFLMALLCTLTAQKGVLWWAAHHRHHHKFSDTEDDVHSPARRGFWWAHVGWILCKRYDQTRYDKIKDFAKYPELRWLNENFLWPLFLFPIALYLAFGLTAVLWGFFVSTTLLWHGTFTINSLSHVFGRKRYETGDDSRNSAILALITMGEGWHNNHHYYQSSTRQGFFWWEIDMSWMVLKALSWAGLVWDLREPPEHVREGGRTREVEAPGGALEPVMAPASAVAPAAAAVAVTRARERAA